jgi:hypothetical protein
MEANKRGKENGRKEYESKRPCILIFLSTIFLSNRVFSAIFLSKIMPKIYPKDDSCSHPGHSCLSPECRLSQKNPILNGA